ncbi:pantoate--beta-alanine ligase [Desulfonatronum sp. SC1]|uniref:pantoate--beta-alanine ligase n=1 Tax=Desulfonatronum sp. SC1 TaxID=2109626 RepID=UPI000D32322E|nr:pantoate--beta-alanine ligase [Desulfonatronum sp. SC1]PTN37756.1 pantoate--beta-alanine ligase [Desulfonatronum sp. SC1]
MKTITQPDEIQSWTMGQRCAGKRLALVPTMGFFHEGHLALMRWARERADALLVSLFVNPTQFGPREDLKRYPRDPERDARLAEEVGVDVLFMPEVEAMFPDGHATWVEAPSLCRGLCAVQRPTHFRGVATVVAKLFVLTNPSLAVFGEKDWQQLAVIRRITRDLDLPVEIHGRPTVREADGLALSSRNVNLSPEERGQAPAIQRGLLHVARLVEEGETDSSLLLSSLGERYAREIPLGRVEYLAAVDPDQLYPVEEVTGPVLIAVAVRFANARLIDNILISRK